MMPPDKPQNPLSTPRLTTNGQGPLGAPGSVILPAGLMPMPGSETPSGPPALSAAPSARSLWCAFRRRWLLALAAGIAGAMVAVAAVIAVLPGRYSADALIMVNPPNAIMDLGENAQDLKTFRENQQAILKSSPVLNAALSRPEVRALPAVQGQVDAVGWLRSLIKVDFNEGPSVMRVTVSGGGPEETRLLVNAVANAFVADAQQRDRDKAKIELEAIDRTLKDTQFGILQKEAELAKKLVDGKIADPRETEKQKEQLRKGMDHVDETLLKLSLDETGFQAKVTSLQIQKEAVPKQPVPTYAVDEYLKEDDFVKKTKQLIAFWTAEKGAAKIKYQEDTAALRIKECQAEIKRLDGVLHQYALQHQDKIREKQMSKIDMDITEANSQIVALKDQKEQLRKSLLDLKAELHKLEIQQTPKEISGLDSAIKSDKAALERMQDKRALVQAKLRTIANAPDGTSLAGGNISVLQLAESPASLDRSRQVKLAGGAGIAMFLLLLLGVTLVEFRARKINDADDLTRGLGLNLVGTVPALPQRMRQPSAQQSTPRDLYWQTLLTESIDSIRTMLLHTTRVDNLQIVMVTSAAGGEGKTSLASHLAASLARAWKKTLLIDGDLRNPAVHKLFGVGLEPGFSDVLRGDASADDAIHATTLGRLWVMSAGNWDSHAVQALAQDSLSSTLDQLKEKYDFIIVDSSPVLPVADTLLLAQHVDAVVFSVLRDVSRAGSVHLAQQRLDTLGVRQLGAVMIGADVPAGAYPYALRQKS